MDWHTILLFVTFVMAGLGSTVTEDCPDVCNCKWKGGKQVHVN
jgi:hypothetical protein